MGLLKIALARHIYAQANINMSNRREGSKKSAPSKATALLTHGAHILYVSTAKWRPRMVNKLIQPFGT